MAFMESIESSVFKRSNVDFNKLEKYGFKKNDNYYVFEKKFLNDDFKAVITIDENGIVSGKIIDLQVDEEYLSIRTISEGEFVNKVRDCYKNILKDIRNNCFLDKYFIFDQSNRISLYIKNKYNNSPQFLWSKFPGYAVFRNEFNNKWYAIIMNVDLSKISSKTGEVEIMNLKLNCDKVKKLLNKDGFYKAYHMNKSDWISIVLDDTLSDKDIISLLDESYNLINEPESWLVPSNPKYYDIINCFNDKDEIVWKQSSNIHIGDIVYIYVGAPYSKIMYKCKAVEVNIPYKYKDNNVSMNYVMKLKLLENLNCKNFNFKYLNDLGIKSIRGPRKITKNISDLLSN